MDCGAADQSNRRLAVAARAICVGSRCPGRSASIAADALCMASGDMWGPAGPGRVGASDRDLRQAPCKGTH
jgi:hypothetical protein